MSQIEQPPLLLRGREVARELGVSRAQAYKMMSAGVLPTLRSGRSVRVPHGALIEWIRRNTRNAAA